MLRIDFKNLPVQRNRPPWQSHHLVEFSKLKIRLGVPLIQFDGSLKMMNGFLAVLRHGRQTPRQERAVLGHVWGNLHALAEPQNGSRKIMRAQGLFGSSEAVVYSLFTFGFALAKSKGARLGKLLVVAGAFLLVPTSPVRSRQSYN